MARFVWLGTVRQWHWISAALCLVGMLLFAVTGITLNHAADIPARMTLTQLELNVPDNLLADWREDDPLVPEAVRGWLTQQGVHLGAGRTGEWQDGEFYLALPRPGGDAWLTIDAETGELYYELSERGWIAYFNDLHKARHTGLAWSWFIDIFAAACVVFSLSGLLLLQRHATGRPSTWPLVGLGLVAPLLLILLFIH